MPDADVDRPDAVAGAQHYPDSFAIVRHRRDRSSCISRFGRFADQYALGTTETRTIEQHAEMAGQSESPRVSIPLSVKQKNVRLAAEPANRSQNSRRFAKAQQSGHVRKPQAPPHDDGLDNLSRGHIPDHDGCDALLTIGRKRTVRARRQSQATDCALSDHAAGQFALNPHRPFRRHVPTMRQAR